MEPKYFAEEVIEHSNHPVTIWLYDWIPSEFLLADDLVFTKRPATLKLRAQNETSTRWI